MCLASDKTVLLSGGLDRRINAFSLDSGEYNLIYTHKTAAPVLALSVSGQGDGNTNHSTRMTNFHLGDDQVMAYGMSNLLVIHKRSKSPDENATTATDRTDTEHSCVTRLPEVAEAK